MRRWSARVGLGLGALAALGGCAGILGDFDVSGESAGDDGGANDGTALADNHVPGSDGGDAASDGQTSDGQTSDAADAGNYLLSCDGFRFSNPIVVDSLDRQNNVPKFPNAPSMVSVTQDLVEILVPGLDGTYTLYWVDKHASGAQNPVVGQYNQNFNNTATLGQFNRITGASAIQQLVFTPPLAGQTYQFISVPDTLGYGNPPDTYIELSPYRGVQGNNFTADFIELTPNTDWFYAFTDVPLDGGGPDGAAELQVGHAIVDGGITQEKVARATYHGGTPVLLHAGNAVHVYLSSDPTQGGALAYKASETASGLDGGEQGRLLSQSLPALMIGAAPGDLAAGGSAGFNFTMAEFNGNGSPLAILHAGSVAPSNLDTFTVADLPAGPSFNDTSELPINGSDEKWAGNEFALAGLGSPAPVHGGVNFVAMDAQGHTRAVHVGANAILQNHTVETVAVSFGQRLGIRYVTWNVAWTETFHSSDGGPDFQRMYLNELICH